MNASPFLDELTASNVVIVAGKGGVGKTTVTAVLARAAVESGQRVLIVELDGKPTLGELALGLGLEVMSIEPGQALVDYLTEHDFGRLARRFSGAIDVIAAATPGIDDVVVLGRIKQLERSGDYDLIVVDGPAAGHAVRFLTSAAGLLETVAGGPVYRQASEVQELLTDRRRCQVILVTVPETTPVSELIETAFHVEDQAGVALGAIVVNRFDSRPPLPEESADPPGLPQAATDAAAFARTRRAVQDAAMRRLDEELPLPRIFLDAVPVAGLTADDIKRIADHLREVSG